MLIALFFIFKPQNTLAPQLSASTEQKKEKSESKNDKKKVFSLIVKDGKIASSEKILSVVQGDEVVLEVVSDVADEMHLHGYDLWLDLKPNESISLKFIADKTGRFSFELEHAAVELGAIEVQPK